MQNGGASIEGEAQNGENFGDTETGGMDVAALGGGAAIAGDALGDAGQSGPDIDGRSR